MTATKPTLDPGEVRQRIHDLRDPLGTISLNLSILESESLGGADLKDAIQKMRKAMTRAVAVLDQLNIIVENGRPAPLTRPIRSQDRRSDGLEDR